MTNESSMPESKRFKVSDMWAKTDRATENDPNGISWGRLDTHLNDTLNVALILWDKWLLEHGKSTICQHIGLDQNDTRVLLAFLAGTHDIGKASPTFNGKVPELAVEGSISLDSGESDPAPHTITGALSMERAVNPEWYSARENSMKQQGSRRRSQNNNPSVRYRVQQSSLPGIIASHHGFPPGNLHHINVIGDSSQEYAFGLTDFWKDIQDNIIDYTKKYLRIDGEQWKRLIECNPTPEGLDLMTGFVIMSDHISSDKDNFTLGKIPPKPSSKRAKEAWKNLGVKPLEWNPEDLSQLDPSDALNSRFSKGEEWSARPGQEAVIKSLKDNPDSKFIIIEDSTGSGKTESALMAAEILAYRTGAGGIQFALPTRATSDAMMNRVREWLDTVCPNKDNSLALVHGTARLNPDYNVELKEMSSNQVDDKTDTIHGTWFDSSSIHRAMAPVVVGTIDHLLSSATMQTSSQLRHIGLLDKVVILDEVHATDETMNRYLCSLLGWLSKLNIPVVACTATLTDNVRGALLNAYAQPWEKDYSPVKVDFPSVSLCTQDGEISSKHFSSDSLRDIKITTSETMDSADFADEVIESHNNKGVISLVYSTVSRAQDAYKHLKLKDVPCILLHSRFTDYERRPREKQIVDSLGPKSSRPDFLVVVSTQVLEMSLDIDVDVMGTDPAPIDILIQRAGRIHRHNRSHELPGELIIGGAKTTENPGKYLYDKGTEYIYGNGVDNSIALDASYSAISKLRSIVVPDDTVDLMKNVDFSVSNNRFEESIDEETGSTFPYVPHFGKGAYTLMSTKDGNTPKHTHVRGDGSQWGSAVILYIDDSSQLHLPKWIGWDRIPTSRKGWNEDILVKVSKCQIPVPRSMMFGDDSYKESQGLFDMNELTGFPIKGTYCLIFRPSGYGYGNKGRFSKSLGFQL